MKILMISRDTLFSDAGGDTVQIVSTAKYLKEYGVDVDIKLSKDANDYHNYDLVHFFNIIRPADIISHLQKIKIPYVISTIFVDYSESESKQFKGVAGNLLTKLSPDMREYLKCIARWVVKGEKVKSLAYLLKGHRWAIKKALRSAAMVLPNSESEYKRLHSFYGIDVPHLKVTNAVDTSIFNEKVIKNPNYTDAIVSIGRIETRKNQLQLIRAVKNSDYRVIIIGKAAVNQPVYYQACREEADHNITFIDFLEQPKIASILAAAKVHVLPSWFETTGLVSLEAAAMGCNIVVTKKGDQCEYFENDVFYCEPEDCASIRKAIDTAFHSQRNSSFQKRVLTDYTWQRAAEKTYEAYCKILKKDKRR